MSHPRLDFIAIESRSKSHIKKTLNEDGKTDLYFQARNNEVLEKMVLEKIIKDGAINENMGLFL